MADSGGSGSIEADGWPGNLLHVDEDGGESIGRWKGWETSTDEEARGLQMHRWQTELASLHRVTLATCTVHISHLTAQPALHPRSTPPPHCTPSFRDTGPWGVGSQAVRAECGAADGLVRLTQYVSSPAHGRGGNALLGLRQPFISASRPGLSWSALSSAGGWVVR